MMGEIETALRAVTTEVERVGAQAWAAVLPAVVSNGGRLAVRAAADGEWLCLETTLDARDPEAATDWRRLAWNAALSGGARFVLARAAGIGETVRADVVLDADADLVGRLHGVVSDFELACGFVAAQDEPPPVAPSSVSDALADRCRETGWNTHVRESGAIEVDLDVPGGFHLANVAGAGASWVVRVDLLGDGEPQCSDVHRRAVAVLLLRTSAAVRMVRASARGARPALDVGFTALPSVPELAHAFAALSVACRAAAAEATVLAADEGLAITYLRHWDERRARRLRAA